jgi:hypothetical protein
MKELRVVIFIIAVQITGLFADSNSINLVGRWANGPCNAVTVDSNYAYVGNGALLEIFDISSAGSVTKTGEVITDGFIDQVEVNDSLLFIFRYDDLLGIYDIRNKSNPFKLGQIYFDTWIKQFFLKDNYVYLSADTFGLVIVDVSNPEGPTIVGTYENYGYYGGIFVKDSITYIGLRDTGIIMLDTRDPTAINEIGKFRFTQNNYATNFHFKNGYLYVTSSPSTFSDMSIGGMYILDLSNPESPVELGYLDLPGDWSSYLTSIFVEDSLAYITNLTDVGDWIDIVNVADPAKPVKEKQTVVDYPSDIFVHNTLVYLTDGYGGFKIYDFADPNEGTLVFHHPTGGDSRGIFIGETYAFISSDRAGLLVVDITDPEKPETVGRFNKGYLTGSDVSVQNAYAYLTNSSGGLKVLDISNPDSIQEIGNASSLGNAMFIQGDFAFIANRYNGLMIIDISDPVHPVTVCSLDVSYNGYDVMVNDTLLFLAAALQGTKIFNISDPYHPVEIITIIPEYSSLGVYFWENYLYLAEGNAGLRIFDISNVDDPVEVGKFSAGGYFVDVKVKDNYAYIADNRYGLRVLNVQQPADIFEVASYKTGYSATDIFLKNDLVYLSDLSDGLYIFQYVPTSIIDESADQYRCGLKQNYPNPFNPLTNIEFTIPRADFVSLKIYNLLGQLIATVVNEKFKAGSHVLSWHANGFASGVYLYRLQAGQYSETKKLILLK